MNAQQQTVLTEDMQMFDYWSQVYSPADRHIDSLRAAYDAFLQHYTLPRTEQMIVEDHDLQLSSHDVNLRVFTPNQPCPEQGWSWVFYVHGGGNVVGSADSHEYIARQLARDLNVKVFLPEYGLLPEFCWSQGTQDCLDAYQQIAAKASDWNICTEQMAIAADASGCVIALQMQQALATELKPVSLALFFPTLAQETETVAVNSLVYQAENQHQVAAWFDMKLNQADLRKLPVLNTALPATFIATAECDEQPGSTAEMLGSLQQSASVLTQITAKGLRGSCLPIMRDCPDTAEVYEAAVTFLNKYLNK